MENKHKNQENHHGDNTHKRGFASMPKEKVEEIASMGGKASGESKHSHKGENHKEEKE